MCLIFIMSRHSSFALFIACSSCKSMVSLSRFSVPARETKFETWFENLLGNESTVGQLINEKKSEEVHSMEERMIEAIEDVVNSNLGGLNMIEMIDAYKEECAELKESSFKKFFGEYEQIKSLIPILKKAEELFPEWETSSVSMADIMLA